MKRSVLLSIGILIGITLFSQEKKMNRTVFDTVSKQEIMIGYCTLAGITDTAFTSAYNTGYKLYKPDWKVIDQIASHLAGVTVTIAMGSWCDDSREQMPKFFKVMELTGYPLPEPVIICTDRDKKTDDRSLEGLDIQKVPTFIFYFRGRELGRIIETPKTTMEKDILEILNKNY